MTVRYIDTGLASGSNNGTDFDNAYQSIKTALESGGAGWNAGDYVVIRRRSSFASAAANITVQNRDGTDDAPVEILAWPRAQHNITSSDWENGSAEVTVDDNDMDREAHQARYIIGPDGKRYMITRVVDSNTIMIDREYPGTTALNNATAYIEEDDLYDEVHAAVDDSSWTIKKTDWDGDPDTLPMINFEATAYYFAATNLTYANIRCIEFKGGTESTYGTFRCNNAGQFVFVVGCLFSQTNNAKCAYANYFRRCTFEGNATGSSQYGVSSVQLGYLKDCAIYNCGDNGLNISGGECRLENVNIGVEQANGDEDVYCNGEVSVVGRDVALGGTYGTVLVGSYADGFALFENYGKVLGAHKAWLGGCYYEFTRVAVAAGSGDPYKRSGGADSVLKIQSTSTTVGVRSLDIPGVKIFEYAFDVDTTSRTYQLYIQRSSISTLNLCRLEATYVDSYDDTTEYHVTTLFSDETINERSGADDWSDYLEVVVAPAVASKVRIALVVSWADSDGILYVDPLMTVTGGTNNLLEKWEFGLPVLNHNTTAASGGSGGGPIFGGMVVR